MATVSHERGDVAQQKFTRLFGTEFLCKQLVLVQTMSMNSLHVYVAISTQTLNQTSYDKCITMYYNYITKIGLHDKASAH